MTSKEDIFLKSLVEEMTTNNEMKESLVLFLSKFCTDKSVNMQDVSENIQKYLSKQIEINEKFPVLLKTYQEKYNRIMKDLDDNKKKWAEKDAEFDRRMNEEEAEMEKKWVEEDAEFDRETNEELDEMERRWAEEDAEFERQMN